MMGPVHSKNNALADSATDTPEWHGLSPKSREFIFDTNRLGILIDLSNASDEVLRHAVVLSRAPVILSHSGMRAVYDHPRNVSDEDAKLVADGGGGVEGQEDVANFPNITAALLRAGYSGGDIANLRGGNVLRGLRQVQTSHSQGG